VQTRLIKFVKVYLVFILSAVLVNVAMEIAVPTPEKARVIAEHGWGHYLTVNVRGIILFYALFNLVGGVIYNSTNLRSVEMGASSLVVGFVLEFCVADSASGCRGRHRLRVLLVRSVGTAILPDSALPHGPRE
jgi:hypothetical protein